MRPKLLALPVTRTEAPLRVVLVGGDQRTQLLVDEMEGLRSFPSSKCAGSGSIKRALATIPNGTTDIVVVLCRWIGHPDYYAIVDICQRARVRLVRVVGGFSTLRRTLEIERERHRRETHALTDPRP